MVETPHFGAAEILPRYVFLEPLYARARVLEIGVVAATEGRTARFLKERGAASVVAIDPDVPAVARAQLPAVDGLDVIAGDYGALKADPFDLIFLHHAAELAFEPGRIQALLRLLKPEGRLVMALRHPGGIALADLSGGRPAADPAPEVLMALLQSRFPCLEAMSQTALFGYSIGPTAARETSTSLDESLLEAGTHAFDLLLAGPTPTGLDGVSLTPLATSLVRELVERRHSAAARTQQMDPLGLADEMEGVFVDDRLRELENRTQEALEEAERVQLTAAQALAERDQLRALVTTKAREAEAAKASLDSTREELERVSSQHAEIKATSHSAIERLLRETKDLKAELEQLRRGTGEKEQLEGRIRQLEAEHAEAQGRLSTAEAQRGELESQLADGVTEREGLVKWLRAAEAQAAEWEERARSADSARESLAARVREAAEQGAGVQARLADLEASAAAAHRRTASQRTLVLEALARERETLQRQVDATSAARIAFDEQLRAAEARAKEVALQLEAPLPPPPEAVPSSPAPAAAPLSNAAADLATSELALRLQQVEHEREGLLKWLRAAESNAADFEERAKAAEAARDTLEVRLRAQVQHAE